MINKLLHDKIDALIFLIFFLQSHLIISSNNQLRKNYYFHNYDQLFLTTNY